MAYYGPFSASSGGGTFNQYTMFFEKLGPSNYVAGGFVIDLSSTYSSLNFIKLYPKKGTRAFFPFVRFEYKLNTPSAGKATVLIRKYVAERISAFGNVSSQPAGVTVQASQDQTSSSESTHTHDASHDHGATASAAMTAAGAGVESDALAPALNTHTHQVDVPNLDLTSGAGTSHNHQDNTLYEHQHTKTITATNVDASELLNGADHSSVTFLGMASGVRA